MPSWKGSEAHIDGYGVVGGPPGLTRAGSKPLGQNDTGLVRTTLPAEFRTVSTVNFRRPFQPSRMLAGSGLRTIPPNGEWMIWVIVMGLAYDARRTANSSGDPSAATPMPRARKTRPRKPSSATRRRAPPTFRTPPR